MILAKRNDKRSATTITSETPATNHSTIPTIILPVIAQIIETIQLVVRRPTSGQRPVSGEVSKSFLASATVA